MKRPKKIVRCTVCLEEVTEKSYQTTFCLNGAMHPNDISKYGYMFFDWFMSGSAAHCNIPDFAMCLYKLDGGNYYTWIKE